VSLSGKLATLPPGRFTKWLTLAAWLLIVAAAVPLAGRLSGVAQDSATVELPRGADATIATGLADRFPDGKVSPGIVVYARAGALTEADRAKVDADRLALARIAVGGQVGAPVTAHDNAALTLTVPLEARGATTLSDLARQVRTTVDNGLPAGLDAKLTGPAGSALDARDAQQHTARAALFVTLAVVIAVLLLTYRSPVLWLLPLVCVGVAFVVTDAVTYLLGRFAGMTVDTGNAAVVTVLVFGVGTDYALLLLARYREELRRSEDRHAAMALALRRAVPAIAASAATVSLSLLCLLAANMGFNHNLGTAGAIAVLCGLSTVVTLLPALLVLLGRWVFWPAVPRPGMPARGVRLWSGWGGALSARPRLVWLGAVVLLGLLGLGAVGIRTGLDDQHLVVGTADSVAGQRLLAAHFPAGSSRPVQVVADAGAAEGVDAALRSVAGVSQVRPPVRATDGTLVRLDAILSDPVDSPAAQASVERIRAAVAAVPDAHAHVGGYPATTAAKAAAQAHDRRVVIPLVLLVVFAVLVGLLRALVAPLLLMGTVVLSYLAALGTGWLLFDRVFGFAGLDVQVMLVGFLFLVALGVDYNIFLVTRIREEAGRLAHAAAVRQGLAATGGVISSAGLVLAATFASLLLAPQVAFIEIGMMVAVGVLIDTVLVRSVLVPALALDVGPAFWWPSRPSTSDGPQQGAVRSGEVHGRLRGEVAHRG
jgi:putative drug exporter of the RND superfamily